MDSSLPVLVDRSTVEAVARPAAARDAAEPGLRAARRTPFPARAARAALAGAACLALLGGCVIAPIGPYEAEVGVAPPAPQAEVIGVAPYPGYVWIGGYWGWSYGRYAWVPGRWSPGRPGYHWVPHHWQPYGGRWRLAPGHWDR